MCFFFLSQFQKSQASFIYLSRTHILIMCNYTPHPCSVSSHVPGVQDILADLSKHNNQPEALLATSDPAVSTLTSKSDRVHATRRPRFIPSLAAQESTAFPDFICNKCSLGSETWTSKQTCRLLLRITEITPCWLVSGRT